MSKSVKSVYEFGSFRVDTVKRVLLREGEPVPLTSKVFDTLLVLVQHDGQLLTKDELMQTLWPDSIVEESNLTQNISVLRRALGESPEAHRYIVTVPGRGYKFVAGVSEVGSETVDLIVTERARAWTVVEEEEKMEEQGRWSAGSETAQLEATPTGERIPARPASSAEYLISELKRHKRGALLTLATLVMAAIAVSAYVAYVAPRSPAITSLAVLPFVNVSGDETMDYLSDGLSESLIDRLSQLPGVKVIARSSSFKYKGQEVDPQEVARALGVQALVLGRVVQRGDSLQVRAELVDAREKTQLWGEHYNRKSADIQAVQEEMAQTIAEKLRVRLTGAQEQRLAKRATENPEAYQLYLNGLFYRRKSGIENARKALDYYHQAVALDPHFALAFAGIADAYLYLGASDVLDPKESTAQARTAVQKALELDERLAEAHIELANLKWFEWDWAGAEREYKRAIELNPNLAWGHQTYAHYLSAMERHGEALDENRRAQELDPLGGARRMEGVLLLDAHRYDEAIEKLRQAVELEPDSSSAHGFLGLTYAEKGIYSQAIAESQKAVSLGWGSTQTQCYVGYVFAKAGQRSEALAILTKLKTTKEYVSPAELAILYAGLGDKEGALASLQRAYDEHDLQMKDLRIALGYDSLRSDPRFQALLRRVGLAP
jgi:TolB-like protein/DNA-binding winged helix-turn-helix (wHTH) protein